MSTLVCPCGSRWKILRDAAGDVVAACPVCIQAGRATSTHWRVAGRDYGWPGPVPIPVDLWIPLGQETPAGWFARFMDTSAQEETHRALVARRRSGLVL